MSEAKAYSREELEEIRRQWQGNFGVVAPLVCRLLDTIDAQAEAIRILAIGVLEWRDGIVHSQSPRDMIDANPIASDAIREAEEKQ